MQTFLVFAALVVIVVLVLRRRRGVSAGASPDTTARPLRDRVEKAVKGGLGGLVPPSPSDDVLVVENNIIAAVFGSGVRTLRTRSLVFGNTITVSISEAAERAIRPVRALVESEIMSEITERAELEGFTIAGRPALQFVVDRTMSGLDATVRTAIDDDTPVTSAQDRRTTRQPHGAELPVTLRWLHSAAPPFVLAADGSEKVAGRSSSADWELDSPLVSGRHILAAMHSSADRTVLRITDLGSTNGTTVDGGPRLQPHQTYEVGHGSVVGLGPDVRIRVLVGTSADQDTAPTHSGN